MSAPRLVVGVLGPNTCTPEEHELGFAVGAELANRGAVLVCGGLGGMMEAAAAGAKSRNGLTLGILPGEDSSSANPYIDVPLPTGIGPFRNMLIARASHAVIAIKGGYGTLSEIAFALRLGVPVVGLDTWSVSKAGHVDAGIVPAATPSEAVAKAISLAQRRVS
jgi:uncharacterized protein (TIGR00725 family)